MSTFDTQEAILEAATGLFLQRGYEGVSIRDITKAVGLTKGAIYHHFESKEALLGAVIGREFASYRIDYAQLPSATFREFLDAALGEMERFMSPSRKADWGDPKGQPNHFRLIWDGMQVLEGFGGRMEQHTQWELEAWVEVVRAALERGELRGPVDPDLIAQLFLSSSNGVWAGYMMFGGAERIPVRIRMLWNGLYESLKA